MTQRRLMGWGDQARATGCVGAVIAAVLMPLGLGVVLLGRIGGVEIALGAAGGMLGAAFVLALVLRWWWMRRAWWVVQDAMARADVLEGADREVAYAICGDRPVEGALLLEPGGVRFCATNKGDAESDAYWPLASVRVEVLEEQEGTVAIGSQDGFGLVTIGGGGAEERGFRVMDRGRWVAAVAAAQRGVG